MTGLVSATPQPAHRTQSIYVTCMAEEHPGNLALTRLYAEQFQDLGAKVTKLEYPGIEAHRVPPDLDEKFPLWISAILALNTNAAK